MAAKIAKKEEVSGKITDKKTLNQLFNVILQQFKLSLKQIAISI